MRRGEQGARAAYFFYRDSWTVSDKRIGSSSRNLIIERVRAGSAAHASKGRHLGRPSLPLDHAAIQRDHQRGQSLGQLAKSYRVSRTTISRVVGRTSPKAPT